MTRFATSVLDQMKHIWKPYMLGALGAVALALVVAAAGGRFVPAETPKSEPMRTEIVPTTLVSAELVIAILCLLASISGLFLAIRAHGSLRSMIERLKDIAGSMTNRS